MTLVVVSFAWGTSSSRRLLLFPDQFGHRLYDRDGVPADAEVVIALGEPADLVDHLPPPDLAQRPEGGNAVLGALVSEHVEKLLAGRADLHPAKGLDRVGPLAAVGRQSALGQQPGELRVGTHFQ